MPSQVNITDMSDAPEVKAKAESKSKAKRTTRKASPAQEKDLQARLVQCFERLAESLEARQDEDLAEIVREDAEVMASGLVMLTRPFKPLRTVVLAFVAVLQPLLAFGRVGRELIGRAAERRTERRKAQTDDTPPDASQ